jgi:membrane-bound serine protease (ClpP class)
MIPAVTITSLFFMGIVALVVKAHMRQSVTGSEGMKGETGEAVTDIQETGKVFLMGEYWSASSDRLVEKGKKVRIVSVDGLKLKVEEISLSS